MSVESTRSSSWTSEEETERLDRRAGGRAARAVRARKPWTAGARATRVDDFKKSRRDIEEETLLILLPFFTLVFRGGNAHPQVSQLDGLSRSGRQVFERARHCRRDRLAIPR